MYPLKQMIYGEWDLKIWSAFFCMLFPSDADQADALQYQIFLFPRNTIPDIISFIPAIEEFQILEFILQYKSMQYMCRNEF